MDKRDVHKHHSLLRHVAQSVTKKLLTASKEKGCEVIMEWMKDICHHLYWSAISTKPGFGNLILSKWNSFMRHVANKHIDHPDPLYKRCNHLYYLKIVLLTEKLNFVLFLKSLPYPKPKENKI